MNTIFSLSFRHLIAFGAKNDLPVAEPLRAEDLVHIAQLDGTLFEHFVREHVPGAVLAAHAQSFVLVVAAVSLADAEVVDKAVGVFDCLGRAIFVLLLAVFVPDEVVRLVVRLSVLLGASHLRRPPPLLDAGVAGARRFAPIDGNSPRRRHLTKKKTNLIYYSDV
jgi:hypothetical protein